MICLDTNILITAINGRHPAIRGRLEAEIGLGTPLGVPAVVLFEMRYGIAKSRRRERSEAALDAVMSLGLLVLPFEAEDAIEAGEIRADLERTGTPIGWYDYLIAAQARRRRVTLATLNRGEFERVPGLMVTNWGAA